MFVRPFLLLVALAAGSAVPAQRSARERARAFSLDAVAPAEPSPTATASPEPASSPTPAPAAAPAPVLVAPAVPESAVVTAPPPAAPAAPAASADASPTAATGLRASYTLDTPIGDLVADPAAKAVLDRDLPGLSSDDNFDKFAKLGLRQFQPLTGGQLTDAMLLKVARDLSGLGGPLLAPLKPIAGGGTSKRNRDASR